MITNHIFFLDSESCMSQRRFGTKVNQEFFSPKMEQKFVQRCECFQCLVRHTQISWSGYLLNLGPDLHN